MKHLSEEGVGHGVFTRREAILAIGLGVASIISACNGKVETVEKDESREKRKLIYGQFVEATSDIVEKTKDPEAVELLRFINENVILAEPAVQGFIVIENLTKTAQWVAVVTLLPGDELKDDGWHYIVKTIPGAGGRFSPSMRAIFIDGIYPKSSFSKGMNFLHEAYHAKHWMRTRYDWNDTRTFCMEEVATYEFQNRITSKLGGEAYQNVLEEEAERRLVFLKARHIQVGGGFAPQMPYDDRLDAIFGPALSKEDKNVRQTNLWLHANFVLLERYFKGDVQNQKGLFLKTIYDEAGLLPGQKGK